MAESERAEKRYIVQSGPAATVTVREGEIPVLAIENVNFFTPGRAALAVNFLRSGCPAVQVTVDGCSEADLKSLCDKTVKEILRALAFGGEKVDVYGAKTIPTRAGKGAVFTLVRTTE
jgi:hypothetical protein